MADQNQAQTVLVTYMDGSTRQSSVNRLRAMFHAEPEAWKKDFFERLLKTGIVELPTASYQLYSFPPGHQHSAYYKRRGYLLSKIPGKTPIDKRLK